MAIDSVTGAAVQGLQHSQRKMIAAAEQIAHAPVTVQPAVINEPSLAPERIPSVSTNRSEPVRSQDLVEPLIELRKQEQLFTASAKMVAIADKTIGSLIDVTS